MVKIHTSGETVYDIIFKNGRPISGNPGGSVLNCSVSLGRLGLSPLFLTDFCNDILGNNIKQFLKNNGVDSKCVIDDINKKTSVALAFLDDNNNANYDFYKSSPKSCDVDKFDSNFNENDILLFGSFYGIMPQIREGMKNLIYNAKSNNTIIIYDPNFRTPHLPQLPKVLPFIEDNIKNATIIKGSNEDFNLIFGSKTQEEAFDAIKKINQNAMIIYTKGEKGCCCLHKNKIYSITAPKISPISTIGAGDNFNAGIIYGLVKNNIKFKDLFNDIKEEVILEILNIATTFAQNVCLSQDNYLSNEFVKEFLSK
ncbi:MAG: PfkB family carbohydrate kinase [Bacteroidales bacterium]|nr:PfkB family carbohydrate kinase [Bacteroidales bacterium]